MGILNVVQRISRFRGGQRVAKALFEASTANAQSWGNAVSTVSDLQRLKSALRSASFKSKLPQ